jgi:NitT/TauT family transport system substrate-binding protein
MKSLFYYTLVILVLGLAACQAAPTATLIPVPSSSAPPAATVAARPPTTASNPSSVSNSTGQTEVSIVMGYIPSVQFAPWYVAEKKGYFAATGVKVKFVWGFEVDGVKLVGANQADFALLGGDQVIQARAQNIPLVYVSNYYNGFPITIFSLKEKNIKTPKDLVGKKVGLPAFYGATYTGWRALLWGAEIKESDVKTQEIGFAQVAAVSSGTVDAAAGYANNEPVQLKLAGKEVNVIQVWDYSKLVGIGLVTNEKMLAEKSPVIQHVVSALILGIQDTIANPEDALNTTIQFVPEAGGQNRNTSKAILDATIAIWKSPHLGYVDQADWAASARFMKDAGFIKTDIDITKAFTNKFVP